MAYPPIPTLVRGAGGAIRVRKRKRVNHSDGTECWGLWDSGKRLILVDATAAAEHQWLVLFHELAHAALNDSGLENMMAAKTVEAVCDAVACARMQEFRGQLGVMDA